MNAEPTVVLYARIPKRLHDALKQRAEEMSKSLGFTVSINDALRSLLNDLINE